MSKGLYFLLIFLVLITYGQSVPVWSYDTQSHFVSRVISSTYSGSGDGGSGSGDRGSTVGSGYGSGTDCPADDEDCITYKTGSNGCDSTIDDEDCDGGDDGSAGGPGDFSGSGEGSGSTWSGDGAK